jgi:hypothetical protein
MALFVRLGLQVKLTQKTCEPRLNPQLERSLFPNSTCERSGVDLTSKDLRKRI